MYSFNIIKQNTFIFDFKNSDMYLMTLSTNYLRIKDLSRPCNFNTADKSRLYSNQKYSINISD